MIPIQIDLSDIIDEFQLSQNAIKGMIEYSIQELAGTFYERWGSVAQEALKSTRDQYTSGLVIGGEGNKSFVKLVGELPNMIEDGSEGFDQKDGFSKSSKIVQKKDGGWYLTIPLRHATPNALGENSVFSNILPTSVYEAVRSKDELQPDSKSVGLKKGEIPAPYHIPQTRPEVITKSQRFEEYTHKSSIYEGLQRATKTYEKATQGQYVTFRRVSDKSDSNSWIHKGFEARNFMEKSLDAFSVEQEVDRSVDNYLAKLGF